MCIRDRGRDILLISVNPWYRFTNVQLAIPGEPHQNIPIFTFGKIEEREGKRIMPVALSVNHGFVSGYQIGLYLKEFQRLLDLSLIHIFHDFINIMKFIDFQLN